MKNIATAAKRPDTVVVSPPNKLLPVVKDVTYIADARIQNTIPTAHIKLLKIIQPL